jgi:type VI secretion system protein ImpK
MREAEDLGEPKALVKLIKYYLELFDKNCQVIGMSRPDIDTAKYALVALLDETVLSIPGTCRDYWISSPLQLEYFGDNIAGEEFYRRLDKLLVEPEKMRDILEIYYLCLSLGFEGKYRIVNAAERLNVIDNCGRTLGRTAKHRFQKLSPHGVRTSPSRPVRRRTGFLLWLTAGISAAAVAVVWIIARLLLASGIDGILSG